MGLWPWGRRPGSGAACDAWALAATEAACCRRQYPAPRRRKQRAGHRQRLRQRAGSRQHCVVPTALTILRTIFIFSSRRIQRTLCSAHRIDHFVHAFLFFFFCVKHRNTARCIAFTFSTQGRMASPHLENILHLSHAYSTLTKSGCGWLVWGGL